jgi:hypothetical protein
LRQHFDLLLGASPKKLLTTGAQRKNFNPEKILTTFGELLE